MNVGQMHTAIQQGVDKINSLQADMLLREEIDIELNKSQTRFINTKYGKNNIYQKGFEQSQKRIDDLRSLVREYSAPVIYKEEYNNEISVDTFKLPLDYLYLVNQRSELFLNDCKQIGYSFSNTDPLSYIVIPFSNFHNGTNFITSLELVADPSNGTLGQEDMLSGITAQTGGWGAYNYPADVVNLQTDIATAADWDSSVTNSQSGTNLITTAVGMFASSAGDLQDSINTVAYGQFTPDALGAKRIPTIGTRQYALNKFVQQDDIAKLLEDPFDTTKHTSPLTTIRGRYIDIYTSDIFIIDKVKITYIRKPKEISLPLEISCELPDHCHQEIVDMTHQLEVGKNE